MIYTRDLDKDIEAMTIEKLAKLEEELAMQKIASVIAELYMEKDASTAWGRTFIRQLLPDLKLGRSAANKALHDLRLANNPNHNNVFKFPGLHGIPADKKAIILGPNGNNLIPKVPVPIDRPDLTLEALKTQVKSKWWQKFISWKKSSPFNEFAHSKAVRKAESDGAAYLSNLGKQHIAEEEALKRYIKDNNIDIPQIPITNLNSLRHPKVRKEWNKSMMERGRILEEAHQEMLRNNSAYNLKANSIKQTADLMPEPSSIVDYTPEETFWSKIINQDIGYDVPGTPSDYIKQIDKQLSKKSQAPSAVDKFFNGKPFSSDDTVYLGPSEDNVFKIKRNIHEVNRSISGTKTPKEALEAYLEDMAYGGYYG